MVLWGEKSADHLEELVSVSLDYYKRVRLELEFLSDSLSYDVIFHSVTCSHDDAVFHVIQARVPSPELSRSQHMSFNLCNCN